MKLVKILWRWSWLLTLPVSVIFCYWSGVTIDRYSTFSVRFPSLFGNLYSYGEVEFQHLLRQLELALSGTGERRISETSDLKTINLFVSKSNIAKLNAHLPQSGFEYVEGGLWDGKKLHKVKIKYRGDNSFHWDHYKKSLRVKTKKTYLFDGMRSFNLVVPKLEEKLQNYLGYKFAKIMGLVAPHSELVNVTLNGKMIGVYILVEKLEELTLRKNRLMPADLYSGELVGMDAYNGISPEVFLHPRLWGKAAVNNHYPADFYKPLEKLVELVNAEDSEIVQQSLSRLLDMKAWGRFAAFETLTQSFHFDDQHNWRIYYDPYRRCFVPIVWDPVAWHNVWRPRPGEQAQLDILSSRLHTVLFKNGDFLRARHNAIEEFFTDGKDDLFLQEVDRAIESITPSLLVDPNVRPADPQRSIDAMQRLRAGIERVFVDVKYGFLDTLREIAYTSKAIGNFQFRVDGRRPLTSLVLSYAKPISEQVTAQLSYLEDGHEVEVDVTGSLSVEVNQVRVSLVLLPRLISTFNEHALTRWQRHRKKVLPGYYELTLTGLDSSNRILEIVAESYGERIRAHLEEALAIESFVGMYRVVQSRPLPLPLVWEGEFVVEKSIELEAPLIIRPGTTVRLSPGVTVILRNNLFAEGTAERPIRFVPIAPAEDPWGAVVLWGPGANGSSIAHCKFTGGSGSKGDLFEYTAMLSVHDVGGVNVRHTYFRDSQITDDMVHIVYSKVHFEDCVFERSLMDALDIDISDAVIKHCYFGDSGNDAIDLMTSNTIVLDSTIENGRDKAVSVGEGSHLLSINNVFRKNAIGVQAKDGSIASLYNTDLEGNDHALDAYKKNWRYDDGGKIFVHKGRFENNGKMISADKKSKILVFDSYMDRVVASKKRVHIDKTVDQLKPHQPHTSKLLRDQKELKVMKRFDSRYWDRVDTRRRGALNVASH